MVDSEQINREVTAAVEARAAFIVCAYVFGSVAQGKAGPLSDYDLALLFKDSVPPSVRFDTKLAIISEVQRISGPMIDVVVLNEAPPLLRDRVIRYGRPLFVGDEKRRVAFEARALREYLDFQWILKRYERALFTRIREGRFGT